MQKPKPDLKTRYEREKKRKRFLAFLKAGIAVLLVSLLTVLNALFPFRMFLPPIAVERAQEGELRLHFIDVGQGDCTVVEFPEGNLLVVDAGDGSWTVCNKLVRYLKGLGGSEISVLITHPDLDHYGGADEIFRLFTVSKLYVPTLSDTAAIPESFGHLLYRAEKSGTERIDLSRYGTIVSPSGAYVVCISPYSVETGSENDASAVLYLYYEGTSVLLTGDISAERETKLYNEYLMFPEIFDSKGYRVVLEDIDVLKVAHHGSSASSDLAWLRLLRPANAVISCGKGNGYGHPSYQTIENLRKASSECEIYRTDELGDIMLTVGRNGYEFTY